MGWLEEPAAGPVEAGDRGGGQGGGGGAAERQTMGHRVNNSDGGKEGVSSVMANAPFHQELFLVAVKAVKEAGFTDVQAKKLKGFRSPLPSSGARRACSRRSLLARR